MFLWWATAGLLDRQTEAAINADAQGLSERWADGGLPALVVTIEDRLAQNIDDDAIYLLVDPNDEADRRQSGELAAVGDQRRTSGYELPVMRAGMKSLATVQRYELPGGFHLLIGRDVQVRAQLRKMLTDALLWAAVVVILMATVGALVIRNLFRRTVANISATVHRHRRRRFRSARQTDRPRRRVRSGRRGHQRHAGPHRPADGRRAPGVRTPSPTTCARRSPAPAPGWRTPRCTPKRADDLRAAIERATVDLDGIVAVFQALLRIAEIEAGSRRSSFARLDLAPLLARGRRAVWRGGGGARHRPAA